MRKSIQLQEQRMKLVQDSRALLNKADSEKRSMNETERETYRKMDADIEALDTDILTHQKQEDRELNAEVRDDKGKVALIDAGIDDAATKAHSAAVRKALSAYLSTGRFAAGTSPQIMASLQADSDTAGGFLVPPQEYSKELIAAVDDMVFMRGLSTVETLVNAESLGIPTREADLADADWTTELLTGTEDTTMTFGKRELKPQPIAKLIKVSNKLLQRSPMGPEAIVRDRFAYKFGLTMEKGFLTGTGAAQPLGVFTASTNGISTGQDVSTDNTATAITADGLINALYNLKSQYQARATWIFHRVAVRNIRKLKDGNGQYLWQPGLGGQPGTILDRPFCMSEYAPSTFTTGLYVGIVGDFKTGYRIVDALSMTLQRLVELYAATNQVGFIGRMESDGMPVLEECFTRVKLA